MESAPAVTTAAPSLHGPGWGWGLWICTAQGRRWQENPHCPVLFRPLPVLGGALDPGLFPPACCALGPALLELHSQGMQLPPWRVTSELLWGPASVCCSHLRSRLLCVWHTLPWGTLPLFVPLGA